MDGVAAREAAGFSGFVLEDPANDSSASAALGVGKTTVKVCEAVGTGAFGVNRWVAGGDSSRARACCSRFFWLIGGESVRWY